MNAQNRDIPFSLDTFHPYLAKTIMNLNHMEKGPHIPLILPRMGQDALPQFFRVEYHEQLVEAARDLDLDEERAATFDECLEKKPEGPFNEYHKNYKKQPELKEKKISQEEERLRRTFNKFHPKHPDFGKDIK